MPGPGPGALDGGAGDGVGADDGVDDGALAGAGACPVGIPDGLKGPSGKSAPTSDIEYPEPLLVPLDCPPMLEDCLAKNHGVVVSLNKTSDGNAPNSDTGLSCLAGGNTRASLRLRFDTLLDGTCTLLRFCLRNLSDGAVLGARKALGTRNCEQRLHRRAAHLLVIPNIAC